MIYVVIIVILAVVLIVISTSVGKESKNKTSLPKKKPTQLSQDIEYSNNLVREENSFTISFENSTSNEPRVIVVDVETTELTRSKSVTDKNYRRFPRIVQFAWMVFDEEFKFIKGENHIIKQTEEIPFESTLIHNITDEIAEEKGVDIKEILLKFNLDLKKCNLIVAHNLEFDKNIIKSEMMRNKIKTCYIDDMFDFCTMEWSTNLCKIPHYRKYDDYKFPKLEELVKYLFFKNNQQYYLSGFHDAGADVRWTAHCFPLVVEEALNIKVVDFIPPARILSDEESLSDKQYIPITARELSASRAFISRSKNKLKELDKRTKEHKELLAKTQERYDKVVQSGEQFSEKQNTELSEAGLKIWTL